MTRQELTAYMESILPADRESMDAARRRQAELAKPPGSLGALEDMSIRLAGVLRTARPEVRRCRVTVLAADNGVVAEGVSCAPQSVTVQQAVNMTRHNTGMSALAAYFGDDVQVVDVGIRTPVPCPQVLDRKVRFSTGDIAVEPAMTEQQAMDALAVGLDLARQAAACGEVPVGCVIVKDGAVVGRGRNRREERQAAWSHAEMEAMAQANRALGTWRLDGCTLYVTLEPCPMCAGAILNARVSRVYFGARDREMGACGGVMNLFMEDFPHPPALVGGVLEEECARVLREFFRGLREK